MLTVIIASLGFTALRPLRRVGAVKVIGLMLYTAVRFRPHYKY
jgi:hypothetical protein